MTRAIHGSRAALFATAIALASAASLARAADAPPADSASEAPISWSATYASRYNFQGLDYSEGRPVLQPEASATLRGFTLSAWGNVDQARHELNEIDLGVERDWSVAPLSGSLGYTHLRYPHRDWEPTHEVIASLAIATALEPSLNVHWDVAAGMGRYWTLGVGQAVPWRDRAVTIAAHLDVHDHYYGMTGIPALETSVGTTAKWAGLSLQPTLTRLWAWPNGDFRGADAVHSGWVFGLECSSE